MSYCKATSIVLKQNEIIVKGGDNNVVPRDSYTARIPRTPQDERTFVKELIGGCIQPTPSCGNYFWWWIRNELAAMYSWDSTEQKLDEAFGILLQEYNNRKNVPSAIVTFHGYDFDYNGIRTYLKKLKHGGWSYTNDRNQAEVMTLYKATYLAKKYRNAEVEPY